MSATAVQRRPGLRWWREALYIGAFYLVYTVIRDLQGSASGTSSTSRATITAFHHARLIIRIERDLLLFQERAVQHAFIHARLFVQICDVFYGSAHFVVTAGVLIWLFRRDPERYPQWRNTLAFTTGLALIGFAFFPLMPPRLLGTVPGTHYGFVDTLQRFGGSWSFDSGGMRSISNQYAAMPSLHFGWSLWCAAVLVPACRQRWTRVLAIVYPFFTLFAIVVTANHYVLDAAGGAVVFAAAWLLARRVTPSTPARAAARPRRAAAQPQQAVAQPQQPPQAVAQTRLSRSRPADEFGDAVGAFESDG